MSKQLEVRFGGYSIKGMKARNQDAFAASHPSGAERQYKGAAAAIADGVSSCEDSHIASQTAVTGFIQDYLSTPPSWSVGHSASRVLTGLNRWLYHENQNRTGSHTGYQTSNRESMLTTFSAVVVKSSTLFCFHVGDSRIYHLCDGELEQLTSDHVLTTKNNEYLSRALGADSHLEVDFFKRSLNQKDRLLLTTDGVHGHLSRSRIKALLSDRSLNLEVIAQQIVDEAYENGSDDNLTALIVEIDQLPQETLDETHQRLTQLPIPPVLKQGNTIDGFEVLQVIFSGTRSHMYLVKDIDSGEQFVLKTPSENFSEDLVYLDGFIREEWVGMTLDHPHVMKTYQPARPKRFMYYVGEYIEGTHLRQWMHDNPTPPIDQVRQWVRQIISGLRAFQRKDMIHQDLKPENIMINTDGQIKILDFGTVLIAGSEEINSPLDKSALQGSVNYIAPEYLVGDPGSFKSDLYSLAVIVYEMLTGQLPYEEHDVKQTSLANYCELHYTPSTHVRKDIPVWIEACLKKALQPNPVHRYSSFSEFMQDLSVPNRHLEAAILKQPLLEKHPIRFWQGLAVLLLVLNVLQLTFH
ncbi:bifunctional protein-serine/threonine kinase/phosphatase [Neptunomonas antarctica]|uniref:Serine/threonine protein phosphatase PrpC n=1 Tax=Neptunomonas antarctica TaxID=619304 RepID=A0A1N7L395_9GAMM|nr:bifunctional protein-serine/threonine kinase/phosphatase [Neptunomonas antarctica]SIS68267.1 Serine/threonine protein phosphatase PrpC [Neptunomonas antarctica]